MYRIFIDETGCSQPKLPKHEQSRYLSLSGVIFQVETLERVIRPAFDVLRAKHFGHTAEHPVVLHRREIVARVGAFECLKDAEKRTSWEADLHIFFAQADFQLITVCLDKKEFYRRWPSSQQDPYHLCLTNMMERYFYFLRKHASHGDVIAEGRNEDENQRLKEAFDAFCREGGRFIPAKGIQRRIASGLKILPRAMDVVGLQIADLLAMPSFYVCEFFQSREDKFRSEIVRKIGRLLEREKYYRSAGGIKSGFGRVWKP